MSQGKLVVRLEQALNVWEDLCFIIKSLLYSMEKLGLELPFPNTGPTTHANEFRRHVINDGTSGNFNYDTFIGSPETNIGFMDFGHFPLDLFTWTFNSRRVFHLSSELQTLLSATTLDGISWKDIHWPFKSFLIELADPIIDAKGNNFDSILVGDICTVIPQWKKLEIIDFTLFSKNLSTYKPIDRTQIAKLSKKCRPQDLEKMRRLVTHFGNTTYLNSFHVTTKGDNDNWNEDPVSKPCAISFREYNERLRITTLTTPTHFKNLDEYAEFSECDKAKHIAISLCLFLSTLPAKKFPDFFKPHWSKKEKRDSGLDLTAITSTANACIVSCEHTLSHEEQETISEIKQGRAKHEKRVHWRRGHWRKKTELDEKNTPNRIWVKPCLVNKHRLMENSVPSGSRSIVVS